MSKVLFDNGYLSSLVHAATAAIIFFAKSIDFPKKSIKIVAMNQLVNFCTGFGVCILKFQVALMCHFGCVVYACS